MKKFTKIMTAIMALIMVLSTAACGGGGDSSSSTSISSSSGVSEEELQSQVNVKLSSLDDLDFSLAQLAGTDNLGRKTLPSSGLRKDKYVGLFYFVATGHVYEGQKAEDKRIYDITKVLEMYPDRDKLTHPIMALSTGQTRDYYDPTISPEGESHFWGKPLYGYYRSDDPWVVRKHLELFENAGIDFLYLDYTNAVIYAEETKVLLDAIVEMQSKGYNPPRVVPMMSYRADLCSWAWNHEGGGASQFFRGENKEKYKNCWFYADERINPKQKPLIVGNEEVKEIAQSDDYWFKPLQWPNRPDIDEGFPWMDWGVVQAIHNGVMVVTVSEGQDDSSEAYFNPESSYVARGWTPEEPLKQGTDEEGVMSGRNFQFKWDNALARKDEVDIVNITGWNEWIVTKLVPSDPAAKGFDWGEFVDNFDIAHSRDAEMMEGGFGDNYYMQIAQNIRSFKGVFVEDIDNVYKNEAMSIDITDIGSWDKVTRKYLDFGSATVARNHTAVDRSILYQDNSNRNDIDYLKIANDGENLYVMVAVKGELQAYNGSDNNWMNLYISTGKGNSWANYGYVINRFVDGEKGSIEAFTGNNSQTERLAENANTKVIGNSVIYAIPLSVLGIKSGDVIEIKATDNLQKFGVTDDFYISGDSAPMGRLNYAYKVA